MILWDKDSTNDLNQITVASDVYIRLEHDPLPGDLF